MGLFCLLFRRRLQAVRLGVYTESGDLKAQ